MNLNDLLFEFVEICLDLRQLIPIRLATVYFIPFFDDVSYRDNRYDKNDRKKEEVHYLRPPFHS